ncbi:DNA topoisomerase 1 [Mycoplasmopsis maculosa]|uniref:DNA topoisomerase 1 n=1 Tax=Mycoplasmopsis maculosa TaxID=114885 RepID=A0A449B5A9_9BACT|nr:type I DNA topoisomerase [Mycoplasmopsis maculosa]VEU75772.1 DNA topoisomerase 1 [Mycoplasmopsis maculosa]
MSKLVIVESPNKVNTIKKYLGENYEVMASVGHIAKLSTKGPMGLGIDLENWEPQYILDSAKNDVVKKLKKAVKDSEFVYIATDPDREGEAIGEHLVKYLKCESKYARIKYNEITKEAILNAINHPGLLNIPLIEAQKARRMLDRIIGFRLSQLMKQKVSNSPTNPSAGRVQSIALKLVVDRENEIEKFIPVKYHKAEAKINDDLIANIFNDEHISGEKEWVYPNELEEIKKVLEIKPKTLIVNDIKISQKKLSTITPLKQAVLYKKSPFTSSVTQAAAQKLYEGFGDGGLISYPRTDSTRLSQDFIDKARKYISEKFGKDYILDEIKGFSGDQDAHEAIRPTDVNLTPDQAKIKYDLDNATYQIYKLIYETTLQALIKSPIRESKVYFLNKNNLIFKLGTSKVIYNGYYVIKSEPQDLKDPDFKLNQEIIVEDFIISDHETKPIARYTEGSLIEKLDEIKVGRPSTFASTVKIILDREYVKNINSSLHPTDFGKIVIDKLVNGFPDIINEGYTAEVEANLDLIANDEISVTPLMDEFYKKFNTNYDQASETMENIAIDPELIEYPCPNCGGQLLIRKNKQGTRFIACKNFPNCRHTASLENDEENNRNAKKIWRKKWSKK